MFHLPPSSEADTEVQNDTLTLTNQQLLRDLLHFGPDDNAAVNNVCGVSIYLIRQINRSIQFILQCFVTDKHINPANNLTLKKEIIDLTAQALFLNDKSHILQVSFLAVCWNDSEHSAV